MHIKRKKEKKNRTLTFSIMYCEAIMLPQFMVCGRGMGEKNGRRALPA